MFQYAIALNKLLAVMVHFVIDAGYTTFMLHLTITQRNSLLNTMWICFISFTCQEKKKQSNASTEISITTLPLDTI